MMNIRNERGIALVMVLILSLIGLAIVSALLFMLTQATSMSAASKFYRTADEASVGGMEIAIGYLANRGTANIPGLALNFTNNCDCKDPYAYNDNIDKMTGVRSDRCDKLCNPTANWQNGAAATPAQRAVDNLPTTADLQFTLGVAPATFDVFAKIVDTVQGNSDVGGLVTSGQLGGAGVVASATGLVTPPHNPYLYRLEVQSQATANPRERAKLSVLFAY